jgi:cytosine/adenosine deaminase-related metal-dependent hydrolase
MADRICIKDISLLAGENLKYIEEGWLLIEKERILSYGSGSAPRETGLTLSLPGILCMPAFVDAHTHIGDTLAKEAGVGRPTIEAVSPPDGLKYRLLRSRGEEEISAAIRHGALEMLANGIGLIGDFREEGSAGAALLRKALVGLPLTAATFGEPDWRELAVRPYEELIPDIITLSSGLGIGDVADFSSETLEYAAELLSAEEKILAVHAAETPEAQKLCLEQWGMTEIARAARLNTRLLLVHVTNPVSNDISLITTAGIPLVLCLRTNGILADGIPPLAELLDAGVPIGLGTDNMMFTSPDMFREMDMLSRTVRGYTRNPAAVTARRVIHAATSGGAQALRLDTEFGSIVPGNYANVIGLNTRSMNLRYITDIYSAVVHRAGVQDIALRIYKGERR